MDKVVETRRESLHFSAGRSARHTPLPEPLRERAAQAGSSSHSAQQSQRAQSAQREAAWTTPHAAGRGSPGGLAVDSWPAPREPCPECQAALQEIPPLALATLCANIRPGCSASPPRGRPLQGPGCCDSHFAATRPLQALMTPARASAALLPAALATSTTSPRSWPRQGRAGRANWPAVGAERERPPELHVDCGRSSFTHSSPCLARPRGSPNRPPA